MIKTAVVILNWNGKRFLETFLPFLIKNTPQNNVELYVADNNSTDDSVHFLKQSFSQIKLIRLEKNWGFAEGYNRALQQIDAEYFVLLNSDVEVSAGWLEPLVEMFDNNPQVGACMPKIKDYYNRNKFEYAGASGGFIDKYGFPFCRGRIFDTIEEDVAQYNESIEVFWATGACLAIRSNLYFEAGGLDKDFFAHMEEIDLCWRLHAMNFKISVVPTSEVFHVGGGTLAKSNPKKTMLNFRNNLAILYKNLDSNVLFQTIFIRLILDGIASLKFLFSGYFNDFWAVIKAHFSFYSSISSLRKKRRAFKSKHSTKTNHLLYPKSIVYEYFVKGKKYFSDFVK
ncbi:MAG TPA: dTDP-Rha--alpha-D-GlcNAc-pyrophosphate polyprenol alpha-3-L-rhamnosyltransferase [Bacteroidales bacterium]|nr:MAG: glycosyl transferase family 2 [Bacteroidetes bacterium GWF2_33_38]OFY90986.1 MAG: glycosyl transferase family 2 [Bacteroidetes bacterium RIFOXYA2_FULL_33_7]HBF89202.1 dTDP-Rha--alpha-D-GlcNAc-pyrophosphate polyprenol alpha-3-L-rhamnosyltransferase [Bacteroidales bacterium]